MLWQYIDRLNAGEEIDRETIAAEHPHVADEIVQQIETFCEFGSTEVREVDNSLGTLGDYTLRRQIGRGGVVYEAWDGSMDRVVALKVLPTGAAVDDKTFDRFMREARTAGKLSHPNVVPVYGVGLKENTPLLRDVDRPIASAFADVADGLHHAHSKGVIHRDIKPSNLILESAGRLRILDFGLARLEGQESLTLPGDFVGTPAYMSPEQAKRRKIPVDHRTDIYSLGATLYELLTQERPFRGNDQQETLSQIIEQDPPKPRKRDPRIPEDLGTIVLNCLRKAPEDRYETAAALAQDLRRFVRGVLSRRDRSPHGRDWHDALGRPDSAWDHGQESPSP